LRTEFGCVFMAMIMTMTFMVARHDDLCYLSILTSDYTTTTGSTSFLPFTYSMMLFVICVRLLQPHTQGITRQ
jgi:hypothetical protein